MAESEVLIWVAAASAVIWSGIGAYAAFVAASQNSLKKRLQQLEQLYHDPQA